MAHKQKLGEMLIQKKLVSVEQVNEALRLQVGGNRRLGYLLIKMDLINGDQLLETLAEQSDAPIIEIKTAITADAKTILPRYLCKKYSLIPLRLKENNVLQVAMIDPSDDEAISDVENYTGKVIETTLARHDDIVNSISKYIPFSPRDIFNAQVYGTAAKFATAVALAMVIALSLFVGRYVYLDKYGTISRVGDSIVFKNQDLMVGIEQQGKISLLGHGAHAKGYYSVSFDSVNSLETFLKQKKKDFSEKQYDWLLWVIDVKIRGDNSANKKTI